MTAAVIYESMFGSTRKIAEAIASGIRESEDVVVVRAKDASTQTLDGIDLVVVGAPTHMHGLSRPSSRKAAVQMAAKPAATLTLEPDATAPGVREWLTSVGQINAYAAAFDTRGAAPRLFTGSAARKIRRELRRHGARALGSPGSFVVAQNNQVAPSEVDRAQRWGEQLARAVRAGTR